MSTMISVGLVILAWLLLVCHLFVRRDDVSIRAWYYDLRQSLLTRAVLTQTLVVLLVGGIPVLSLAAVLSVYDISDQELLAEFNSKQAELDSQLKEQDGTISTLRALVVEERNKAAVALADEKSHSADLVAVEQAKAAILRDENKQLANDLLAAQKSVSAKERMQLSAQIVKLKETTAMQRATIESMTLLMEDQRSQIAKLEEWRTAFANTTRKLNVKSEDIATASMLVIARVDRLLDIERATSSNVLSGVVYPNEIPRETTGPLLFVQSHESDLDKSGGFSVSLSSGNWSCYRLLKREDPDDTTYFLLGRFAFPEATHVRLPQEDVSALQVNSRMLRISSPPEASILPRSKSPK